MLQWLAVGFTGGSDRFRQADRKTKQNRATEQVRSWKCSGVVQRLGKKTHTHRAHLLFMFSCRGVKSFVKPLIVLLTLSL